MNGRWSYLCGSDPSIRPSKTRCGASWRGRTWWLSWTALTRRRPAEIQFAGLFVGAVHGLVDASLRIRDIDALVLTETIHPLIASVQLAAALVLGVGVVVCDALAAEVVKLGLHPSGNRLRMSEEGFAVIVARDLRAHTADDNGGERQESQRSENAAHSHAHGI